MDKEKYLILVKGIDKTASIERFKIQGEYCEVVYSNSPKAYRYNKNNVTILEVQQILDPMEWIVTAHGAHFDNIERILDFGTYYRFVFTDGGMAAYSKDEIIMQYNCLMDVNTKTLFDYFSEIASCVSLVSDKGINILSYYYGLCNKIGNDTVLANYLSADRNVQPRSVPQSIIYPFGLNQSQKKAVENALSYQVSIIQGPPGTGKTQTILNIIANVVRNGKTVAVVSNNNSAILNVAEKLESKELSFLTAFLGSKMNKERFLESQTDKYPNMESWVLSLDKIESLKQEVTKLSEELDKYFDARNRISAIEQELLELKPEQHYFNDYYGSCEKSPEIKLKVMTSQKILALWLRYEDYAEKEHKLGLLQKLSILFSFNYSALKLFNYPPDIVIPYLQQQFYIVRQQELAEEKAKLEQFLDNYCFNDKIAELTEKSLKLFKAELSASRRLKTGRRTFTSWSLRFDSDNFTKEYPVVLSTAYSIKGVLNPEYIYDYLIVDEASQVDLATGVLAMSCAKNIVIVGDLNQLPNVLTRDNITESDKIGSRYTIKECYRYSSNSLLSSAQEVWKNSNCPEVLLREHYRCHPKIINFCNQRFYGGDLIVMTEDNDEPDVLTMYQTTPGNHARGHFNQRQIDVIREEVLPRLKKYNYDDIGIITPYRDQVDAIKTQLKEDMEVATVHKFQGREKKAIILTSVDNVITDFVNDSHMLNVAVSRAINSLTVITSNNPQNDKTNYGDLVRYIEYQNCEVIDSAIHSVFDLLYKGYNEQRQAFLKKQKKVSEYDSENLLYAVISGILEKGEYSSVDCAVHVSLNHLIKDYSLLNDDESSYARNPLTHVDFLLFRRVDKSPLLAIEADGTAFHAAGSIQVQRDEKKNHIFELYGIPLLRLRTNESNEASRIEEALSKCLH